MSARMQHRSVLVGVLSALTVAAALLPAGAASAAPAPSSGCADVQIVSARGTGETDPVGRMESVAREVQARTSRSVDVFGLPYPASYNMASSALEGDKLLGKHVNQQTKECPKQKLVLLGYSQGAWVVGDALTGGATLSGVTDATITPEAGRKVAAVVLFGDPRFTAGETFNKGTFTAGKEGNYPRPMGAYGDYSKRIRSYCDGSDQTCQNVTGLGHLGYWPKYDGDAANFILRRLGGKSTPAPVVGIQKSDAKGLPPELQKKVNETIDKIMKQAGEEVGKAVGDSGVAAPEMTSPATTPPPAGSEKPKKHWWDTVIGWLNPFD